MKVKERNALSLWFLFLLLFSFLFFLIASSPMEERKKLVCICQFCEPEVWMCPTKCCTWLFFRFNWSQQFFFHLIILVTFMYFDVHTSFLLLIIWLIDDSKYDDLSRHYFDLQLYIFCFSQVFNSIVFNALVLFNGRVTVGIIHVWMEH